MVVDCPFVILLISRFLFACPLSRSDVATNDHFVLGHSDRRWTKDFKKRLVNANGLIYVIVVPSSRLWEVSSNWLWFELRKPSKKTILRNKLKIIIEGHLGQAQVTRWCESGWLKVWFEDLKEMLFQNRIFFHWNPWQTMHVVEDKLSSDMSKHVRFWVQKQIEKKVYIQYAKLWFLDEDQFEEVVRGTMWEELKEAPRMFQLSMGKQTSYRLVWP